MAEEKALKSLANYWRKQAEIWRNQEEAWHETVLFCRQIKEELHAKNNKV